MKRLLTLAVLALCLAGCSTPTADELRNADYGSYPYDYESIIRSHMRGVLKDPESARYEFLNSPKIGWNGFGEKQFGHVVCVNINAKNSYGGYVGNRLSYFMIRNGRVVRTLHSDGSAMDGLPMGACKAFI